MQLLDYFKELYHINDDLEQFFDSIMEVRDFAKGELIFEPGTYLKYFYFIESGFTRMYYYKNRREITHYFFGPNTFSSGSESVFYGKPTIFGFQALAPSRICIVPFAPVQELADTDITVNKIIQTVLLDSLINFSNRFYKTQFETAHERYNALIEENPELFQNASLGHIASYLGISQQTLSVIRGMK
ncbi:Crp/Fnr family transcriptional regulator [Sphingobacterium lactis]|uniref:cAMP-binding domain of CRP or a regulatory subunit of cAMP-dependent protein kinases n=1 Tax=Sphingobacterium lactis TaxID=797291 RepID=A0A1H5YQF5_9SPHI|nr:Crp/Fnr family transcriptional regulator [Sphingobacterium lactis]SEG26238.1 cAMP-binding domain of CRP or a regulatory subunit of cAMP-dependent protein kinases [Sphingobacterium lactis]